MKDLGIVALVGYNDVEGTYSEVVVLLQMESELEDDNIVLSPFLLMISESAINSN